MAFTGITDEFRKTDEYKELYSLIKSEHPDMFTYLVEMAIAVHKKNPKMFKEYRKCQRADRPVDPIDRIILGAVNVYESEDGVPKAEHVKVKNLSQYMFLNYHIGQEYMM
jgi:hypothetical protein